MMPAATSSYAITLDHLLEGMVTTGALPNLCPAGISLDSRKVVAGGLFLACAGIGRHGMDFVAEAVSKGAAAVLVEPTEFWTEQRLLSVGADLGVSLIAVPNLSGRAGELAARFYGRPSDQLSVIGITGTNGKTSISHFLATALADERRCGVLGTLGYGLPGALRAASHTTPDAVCVQSELADLRQAGADCVAMEVSSHALHQHRVAGVQFHTAVFSNLSRDHLDYHGDMARYGEAKAALFLRPDLQLAVINRDDAFGAELIARHARQLRVVACGVETPVPAGTEGVTASNIQSLTDGLTFTLTVNGEAAAVRCGLLGRFNVDNLLLVAGVLHGWGYGVYDIVARLGRLTTVPGRMQRLGADGQPAVVVDYAHTPDALEQVLRALRPHVVGQLHCVFGCGGDRDAGKRPLMGAVAEANADRVVITDDNPRSESGDVIVQQIMAGMQSAATTTVVRDRAQAIAQTIQRASAGDVVLVAGKGHEDYQLIGDLRLPFSDVEQVRKALGGAV